MRAFDLRRPTSVADAASLLASLPDARLLAGGTDLICNLRRRIEHPAVLVDLTAIPDLDVIEVGASGLVLGAGATLARLAGDERIARDHRAVAEAAQAVAGPGHRNVATVGGNLCLDTRCVFYNQSEWWRSANGFCLKRGGEVCHVAPQGKHCHAAFSGDLAPALLALGAQVEIVGARARRNIPLADLYRDDGANHLALARDEVLSRVVVPKPAPGSASAYRKSRVRGAIDFPLAGVACALALENGALASMAIALTGTNSRPLLLAGTEELLGRPVDDRTLGALAKLVQKQTSPMRTTLVQSNYRRQVATVLAQRLVTALAQQVAA